MASLEDLIATINGGMHAGQQGSDLKDLHAKLAQTLHPTLPVYRPVPPQPAAQNTSQGGPLPPPAPASSWNSPPPVNTTNNNLFPSNGLPINPNSGGAGVNGNSWGGMGNSPRQGGAVFTVTGQKDVGFNVGVGVGKGGGNVPPPGGMPYHTAVLPVRASPKDTGGFSDDAFKPLWNGGEKSDYAGFGSR